MRRWLPVVLIMGVLLTSCGSSQSCTLIGGAEVLTISTTPAIRKQLDTIRVDLRQAKVHRTIAFGAQVPAAHPVSEVPGVIVRGNGRYVLSLAADPGGPPAALPGPWSPRKRVHLTIEGLNADRKITYRHREIFAFKLIYPNGKGCGGRSLLHTTSFGPKDKLAVPIQAPKDTPYTREMLAPINRRIIDIAGRRPGFISIKDDLEHLTVTVTWAGRAPNELKKYAATWPNRVKVNVVEHAKP